MLCISHLDYSNGLLYGLPNKTIKRYQIIQNIFTKLVLDRSKYFISTETLKCLHWLPTQQRIAYKIGLLMFKCIKKIAPKYLQELITIKKPNQENMCINNTGLTLKIPKVKHETFTARSFKHTAPTIWNSLPKVIRTCNTLTKFKSLLNIHLYKEAFDTKVPTNATNLYT